MTVSDTEFVEFFLSYEARVFPYCADRSYEPLMDGYQRTYTSQSDVEPRCRHLGPGRLQSEIDEQRGIVRAEQPPITKSMRPKRSCSPWLRQSNNGTAIRRATASGWRFRGWPGGGNGAGQRQPVVAVVGGYLHDVGKVGIPDSVLFKPGKLTAGRVGGHAHASGTAAKRSAGR